jgi:ribosomal-protein-alanine N-acetyltransferase
MDTPTITTSRLSLRSFTFEDTDALHQILSVPGVLQYFPSPEPPERERVEKLIDRQIRHWQDFGYGWWAVEGLADEQLLGWSGLQYLPETDEIEIGYLLGKPYWGVGLATESAQAGLDFGFGSLGLDEIVGIVHPDNLASLRVLEKIGLEYVSQAEYFGMACYQYKITRAE